MKKDVTAIISSCKFGTISISEANTMINEAFAKTGDSIIIGEHIEGCNIKKLVDENAPGCYHPWAVLEPKFLRYCNAKGEDMTEQQLVNEGRSEMWLEYKCFGKSESGNECPCRKRIRVTAIATM